MTKKLEIMPEKWFFKLKAWQKNLNKCMRRRHQTIASTPSMKTIWKSWPHNSRATKVNNHIKYAPFGRPTLVPRAAKEDPDSALPTDDELKEFKRVKKHEDK